MWLFLLILFGLATVMTVIKASLLESRRMGLIKAIGLALAPWIGFSTALRTNARQLFTRLEDGTILSNLCVLLVIESIVMLLFAARVMHQHERTGSAVLNRIVGLLPGVGCVAGLFILLVYVLNTVTSVSYAKSVWLCSLGTFLLLSLGSEMARWTLKHWLSRVEVVLILCFLQLVLAMFTPLMARGLPSPNHSIHADWAVLGMAVGLSVLLAGLAACIRHFIRRMHFGDISR